MKHIISICFAIIFSAIDTKSYAYDIAVENEDGIIFYYNYINDGTELEVTYQHYDSDSNYKEYKDRTITIPSEVTFMNRTRKVTQIGKAAFAHAPVKKIIIPETIKNIENYAFFNSKINEALLPNSLETLGGGVFDYTFVKSIFIGDNLRKSGKLDGSKIDSIIIKNLKSFINIDFGEGCLGYFWNFTAHLYDNNKKLLKNVVIPEGVTSLGYAFTECSTIESVTIPKSMTKIDKWAFKDCSNLRAVNMHDDITKIGEEAFTGNVIEEIQLPENLDTIEISAFSGCKLTNIIIPNKVTAIYSKAFGGCPIKTVVLPQSLKTLEPAVFDSDILTVVSKITDPENTTAGKLRTIISGFKTETYFRNAFNKNTLMNATLYVPYGTKEKYKVADGWKEFKYIEEGDPTGILPINETNSKKETKRYNVSGQKIIYPHKGINIIKMSDGTTKKVVVK